MEFDLVSSWLEQHVRPQLLTVRREFQGEYCRIYHRWTEEEERTPSCDDQGSLERLTGCADEALRRLAQDKPSGIWLSVIRSLPLPVVDLVALPQSTQERGSLLWTASQAACMYGKRVSRNTSQSHELDVSPDWLEDFLSRLAGDIGRFLGAAHTRNQARGWYRIAGKGGVLRKPHTKISLDQMEKALGALQPGGLMIVPGAEFANEAEIMPLVRSYDERSAKLSSPSGVTRRENDENEGDWTSPVWWGFGAAAPGQSPTALSIYYPLQNITLETTSYLPIAKPLRQEMAFLRPFQSLFESRVGMEFTALERSCRSLDAIIHNQTGLTKLKPISTNDGKIRFRSIQATPDEEERAAGFLYSATARGLLRAPRESWISQLTSLNAQGGAAQREAKAEAERFVTLFTGTNGLDHNMEPTLFLTIDESLLALDFLATGEFMELCARKATTRDDAPDPEARRGARFERFTWETLASNKALRPVALNMKLKEANAEGEIDVAFYVGDVLVVIECKSWQKRKGYLRGDRDEIVKRNKQLSQTSATQMGRNIPLLLAHLGGPRPPRVASFICVASPEFIFPDHAELWYGPTCRVLTPAELGSLIADAERWRETVRHATK